MPALVLDIGHGAEDTTWSLSLVLPLYVSLHKVSEEGFFFCFWLLSKVETGFRTLKAKNVFVARGRRGLLLKVATQLESQPQIILRLIVLLRNKLHPRLMWMDTVVKRTLILSSL